MNDYPTAQVKSDLFAGILNYMVYEEVGEEGLEKLSVHAEKLLKSMTVTQMRLVVSLILRDPSMDFMDLIERVKEGYID